MLLICRALAFLLSLGLAQAQAQQQVRPAPIIPAGYCQLTPLASATLLSSCAIGIPAGAEVALIVVSTANIRYRDDGTAPTASVGAPVLQGQNISYQGDLRKIQFIAQSGSPVLDIVFYKYVGG